MTLPKKHHDKHSRSISDTPLSLHGKTALVTGGALRVGRAVALRLAAEGMDVAITYRQSQKQAAQVVKLIQLMGGHASAIKVDLASETAAQTLYREFKQQFDRLDVLVHNASLYEATPVGKITAETFDRQIAVNVKNPLLITQQFAPMLAEHAKKNQPANTGRIINFLDIHVLSGHRKNYPVYAASKAALMEITRCLALALAPKITVNGIAPGVIAWAESYTQSQRKKYLQRVPLGRAGTPEEAAETVLFLARDAHYITGQVLALDGGRSLT